MIDLKVQRVLIAFLRRKAPLSLKCETVLLRDRYAGALENVASLSARRDIAREYRQARSAMIIRLARTVPRSCA